MQRGHGSILFHKAPYLLQPGYGIGSFFKSIARFLFPAAKKTVKAVAKVGKSILANPAVKDILDTVKEETIKTGVNAAANLIAGQNVAEPLQSDIEEAREKVAKSVRKVHGGSGVEGRKRKKPPILQEGGRKKKLTSYENLFSAVG